MIVSTFICVFILFITITVSALSGGHLAVEDQGNFTVIPSNIIDQWKGIQNFNKSVTQSFFIDLSVNDWIQEEILLNKVDILSKDENGTTFLHIAAIHGKYELIQFFITKAQSGHNLNTSANELQQSQYSDNSVFSFNKLSYYINYQDKYLDSPFHKACFNGHENIARLFITHGADIHLKTQGGANALHIAAYQNQVAIVNMLIIDYHISVDSQTNSGVTALHYAVGQGHQETVKALLLHHKANVNIATNTGGATPLHVACQKGNIEMMKLLLIGGDMDSRAADIYVKNTAGLTSLDVYETAAITRFKAKLASAAHQNINNTNTSSYVILSNVRCDDETKLKLNQKDKAEDGNVKNDEEMLLLMKEIQTIKMEMVELYDSMTATAISNANNSNNNNTFKTNEL